MPKVGTARAVMERAFGPTRAISAPASETTDERGLLGAYALQRPERVVARVLDHASTTAFCELSRRQDVLESLAMLPGAAARALERTEAALARRFNVAGVELAFGAGRSVAWHRDLATGRLFPLVPAAAMRPYESDMEPALLGALGRLESLIALGQGYWIARDPRERTRCAEELVALVNEFLDENPVGYGIHWTRAGDVALRASNIAQALRMFADAPAVRSPAFVVRALTALAEHVAFVERQLVGAETACAAEAHTGLFLVAVLFPGLPSSRLHRTLAQRGLAEHLERAATAPEGFDLELFALVQIVSGESQDTFGRVFRDRLARQFGAVHGPLRTSEPRPRILGESTRADARELASIGAILFREPRLKRPEAPFPDDGAWLFGSAGVATFEGL